MGVTQQEIQKKVPNLKHDEDDYGIVMGTYAHYLINTFNTKTL